MPPRRALDKYTALERERLIQCPVEGCEYVTLDKHDMTRHEIVHKPEARARYPCTHEGCTYLASLKSNLTRHALLHLAERPTFVCDAAGCGRAFKERATMVRHKKVQHEGWLPPGHQQCPAAGCGMIFSKEKELIRHEWIKHTANRNTCMGCNEAFYRTSALKLHLEQHAACRGAGEPEAWRHRKAIEAQYTKYAATAAGAAWTAGEPTPSLGAGSVSASWVQHFGEDEVDETRD